MTNKKRNLITSVIFLVFGAFMLVQSLAVPHKIPSDVGSGYVPAFISICLLVVAGAKLILTLLDKDPADEVVKKSDWSMKGGIVTIAIILVYMLAFEPVGFILSSIVFLFALMNWFANNENRNPILFAITDIIISGFEREHLADKMEKKKYQLRGYGLSVQEFIQQIPNTIISAVIGIGIGILPCIGGSTSGLLAYTAARNRSKYPEKFGTGNIGALVAQKAHFGFNMNVIAYDPFAKNVPEYIHLVEDRDEIFKQADYVSLHVPALPSTIHSVSDREFDMMKETAYLINTARGAIVDEPALIRALQEKKIAGAGLDTVEKEPFDLDNPLLSMENVVVAPHIGGATQEASTRSSVACAIAIDDFFAGRTPKFVVPELRELIAK